MQYKLFKSSQFDTFITIGTKFSLQLGVLCTHTLISETVTSAMITSYRDPETEKSRVNRRQLFVKGIFYIQKLLIMFAFVTS